MRLPSHLSLDPDRGLPYWMAVAFAVVPVLFVVGSTFRGGIPYLDLGGLSVRAKPLIEMSVFAISLYVLAKRFRKDDLFRSLAWTLMFLVIVIGGIACVELLKSVGSLRHCVVNASLFFVDFVSAMMFVVGYRRLQERLRRR